MRIGIVGAGAASAALTYVLAETTDAELTVLEKSGGLTGRAATRRHGELTYDHGANYLKSRDERINELIREVVGEDGLVDAAEPIYVFDEHGNVSEGRDSDAHKWSYARGLTQIGKRLFGASDAEIERRTRIDQLTHEPATATWTATDTDDRTWGPFDALVMNPPAPQTAALLEGADWEDPRRTELAEAAASVPYRTIYTGVLHYEFELEKPYYGLVNVDKDHEVGWISREECKAGHVPAGESLLIVQANHEWAVENYDRDPDAAAMELAGHAASILGDERLERPAWTDTQGWRHALPDGAVDPEPVAAAEAAGLWSIGDWVPGEARLHEALRVGMETGERLAEEV